MLIEQVTMERDDNYDYDLIDLGEAAKLLACSTEALRCRLKNEEFAAQVPTVRPFGRRVYLRRRDVIDVLKRASIR